MNTTGNAIEMRNISKSFNGVEVLHDVDFEVRAGEVHALVGGNGAGKSTLMKILQGVYLADSGSVAVAGKPVHIASIDDARGAGIGMVFQEFSLVASLTVAQNIYLRSEPVDRFGLIDDRQAEKQAAAVFAGMEVEVDPHAGLYSQGTACWQLTEIAKAIAQDAQVLIMDEPTASLARQETEALFALIGRLKQRGIAIIYISHRMEEVYRLADRITILRDGRRLLTDALANVTPAQIVEGIVGRKMDGALEYHPRAAGSMAGEPLLEARGLNAGRRVRDVSFTVRAGEILGLAGLMGSGRTELARVLFGIDRLESGEILMRGQRIDLSTPGRAIAAGVALIPEDRRAQGLVLEHSVNDNLLLPLLDQVSRGGMLNLSAARKLVQDLIRKFAVVAARPDKPVRLLSGGNQQKVVLAKWLLTEPSILILDEPTRGIDVGAKFEIYSIMNQLVDNGVAIVMISSELPEVLGMSDRILVLHEGRLTGDLPWQEATQEKCMYYATGGK